MPRKIRGFDSRIALQWTNDGTGLHNGLKIRLSVESVGSNPTLSTISVSSNSKTAVSKTAYLGAIPRAGAIRVNDGKVDIEVSKTSG